MKQRSFARLMKSSRNKVEGPRKKLAVMGDCSTQHLSTAIRGCAWEEGVALEVLDVDYNQIQSQVLDPNSDLFRFDADVILIFMCAEHLYEEFCHTDAALRADFADREMEKIRQIWQAIAEKSNAAVWQFTFAENDDRVFGDLALSVECSYLFQLRRLNVQMMEYAAKEKKVMLIDLAGIQNAMGRAQFYDAKLYHSAKMPVSMAALPTVAARVTEVLKAQAGVVKKCVVLDLDNTIWGGVIGDDGLENIQIGELGLGRAFTEFQRWLKELKKRGVLLAVCSKNNEEIAKEPFVRHPDMVLKLEDIAMFVANWQDKAGNIRKIQQTLNLGMDSFVFLDDNPFERNAVRALIPEITVPELPEDPAEYVNYLKSLNLFETASYSAADAKRTEQYRSEADRVQSQQRFADYEEYLESLEMVAEAAPFDVFHMARIAQLSQRSNQFNLRTVRYTTPELEKIAADERYVTLYFTLKDRFGEYGLVSAVILEKVDAESFFVDSWFMSCRVLKRGMEEFIINTVVETVKQHGGKSLIGEYLPTAKNAMVKDIYPQHGFVQQTEGRYILECMTYEAVRVYIKKAEEM